MQSIRENEVRELLEGTIFKYGPYKNLDRTLRKETLGFSSLMGFNDICEFEYRVTHYFRNIEESKTLLQPVKNAITKLNEKVDSHLHEYRVSCFSHSPFISLMWAHYADHHRGVCYCFKPKPKLESLFPEKKGKIGWGNVLYSSHVPEITVFQEKTTDGMLRAAVSNVVLTKSSEWSYEQELRYFHRESNPALSFDPHMLTAIIVGRRADVAQIENTKKLIQEYNDRNNTTVRLLFSHRLAQTFRLGVDSNFGYRNSCESNFSANVPVLKDIESPVVTSLGKS